MVHVLLLHCCCWNPAEKFLWKLGKASQLMGFDKFLSLKLKLYVDSIQVEKKFLELTEFTYTFTRMKQTKWENHKWRLFTKNKMLRIWEFLKRIKSSKFLPRDQREVWGRVLTWQFFLAFRGDLCWFGSGAWVFILAAVLLLLAIGAAAFYAYKKRSV